MKQKSVKIDSRLFEAAEARLKEAGWEAEYAIKYFLAEVAVRKRLPAFLNQESVARSCSMCKFYEPLNLAAWKEKRRKLKKKAQSGVRFTAMLHESERGGYWCEIPAFNGCISEGSSLDEAKHMIADAARCWLDVHEVNLRYRVISRQKEIEYGMNFATPEEALAVLKSKGNS